MQVEGGPSFLPNLGVQLGVEYTLARSLRSTRGVELHAAWQFLDDEDFLDDGFPGAGPWYQVGAGVRWGFSPTSPRHLVARVGGVWIRAEGEPNLLQEEGAYIGAYGGVGFETAVRPGLSVGPHLVVMGLTRTTKLSVARPIPQLSWRARVGLGRAGGGEEGAGGRGAGGRRAGGGGGDREGAEAPAAGGSTARAGLPAGELYAGLTGLASPGLGGGLVAGQVFRRDRTAVWSVEVTATTQPAGGGRLFFEEDGRWIQLQGGVRARFQPQGRTHWTAGLGAVWLRTTAATRFLDLASDHVGGYVDLGWELDVTPMLATGPEASMLVVSYEKDLAFRVVPQLRWRLVVRP